MDIIGVNPLAAPVSAQVAIPGSKSYTNRALIMAAMTKGRVVIRNPLLSDDTEAMLACLQTLGIACTRGDSHIEVSGDVSDIKDGSHELDANLSGTSMRFLLALAGVVPGTKILKGKEGLHKRPIHDLVDGLRQLGADVEYIEKAGFPPLRVTSSRLTSSTLRMNGGVSSQYFSAILMIAPLTGELTMEVVGDQISKPYIDMTIDTMKEFGVTIENDGYKRYRAAAGQAYAKSEYAVEGDVSSASYFAAIAALTGSTMTLTNMNPASVQADMGFLKILAHMGSDVSYGKNSITVEGRGVKALTVDMEDCPDQAQTLAVLAAFAPGTTTISGVRSLRVKETERVKAVEQELAKMGIGTSSTEDILTIHGGAPKAARIATYGDHRMAMSFAVAGAKFSGMEIEEPEVVGKTFPEFWDKLRAIGVGTEVRSSRGSAR